MASKIRIRPLKTCEAVAIFPVFRAGEETESTAEECVPAVASPAKQLFCEVLAEKSEQTLCKQRLVALHTGLDTPCDRDKLHSRSTPQATAVVGAGREAVCRLVYDDCVLREPIRMA